MCHCEADHESSNLETAECEKLWTQLCNTAEIHQAIAKLNNQRRLSVWLNVGAIQNCFMSRQQQVKCTCVLYHKHNPAYPVSRDSLFFYVKAIIRWEHFLSSKMCGPKEVEKMSDECPSLELACERAERGPASPTRLTVPETLAAHRLRWTLHRANDENLRTVPCFNAC